MLQWTDPLSFIHGLTTQQRRVLKSLEIETVGELLSILPRRYDDYSRLTSISEIPHGIPVTIRATLTEIARVPTFRRRFAVVRAVVSDTTGSIGVTWFNQPWLLKQLKKGDEIFLSGTVTQRPRFGRGFTSPLWEPATRETLAAGTVAPVYPLSGGLTQKTLRKIIKATLEDVTFPADPIPDSLISPPSLGDAYRFIHRPSSLEEAERGRRRLAFDEFFFYQLALRLARQEANEMGAPIVEFDELFAKKFANSLPFELTADQKKVVWSAIQDMQLSRPMRRLLQGDVGSGKTIVAGMLAALVFRSQQSAALMAPTDLLAKQHAATLERFLVPYGVSLLLCTSSTRWIKEGGEERVLSPAEIRERLRQGRLVVVGTHALLERDQIPPDLALAIVDEQHRFGVAQREALIVSSRPDGKIPHLLSMSATPIPRSLALTLLGDLDVSVIHTKPQGRLPITTEVIQGEEGRERAYQKIREEVSRGHRAFIVCPLIDPSDVLGAKSVQEEVKKLSSGPLKGFRLSFVHGKMTPMERDETMVAFAHGSLDILVATTVIEVGVDVPEATIMLVEGAERFGLAQLHQLRGRVGRSNHPSFCFLAATDDDASIERLRVLERTNDGFEVAEADLHLRGSGNLLGTEQSGLPLFKAARMDDLELMAKAREVSTSIITEDPHLARYPELKRRVLEIRQTSHRE